MHGVTKVWPDDFGDAVNNWKRKEKQFDELFALSNKVTHQLGLLIMMWVGMLTVLITTVVVSVLGMKQLFWWLTR
jgi:hypothetical protein